MEGVNEAGVKVQEILTGHFCGIMGLDFFNSGTAWAGIRGQKKWV